MGSREPMTPRAFFRNPPIGWPTTVALGCWRGDFERSCAVLPPTVPPLVPITSGYGERLRISPSLLLAACALIPREKRIFEALAPTVRDGCRGDVFLSPTAHRRRQPHWKHVCGDRYMPLGMWARREHAGQNKKGVASADCMQKLPSGAHVSVSACRETVRLCKNAWQESRPGPCDAGGPILTGPGRSGILQFNENQ